MKIATSNVNGITSRLAAAPRLIDANVDTSVRGQPRASDHAPVWVELSGDKSDAGRASAKRS
jgi:exonuclease III